VNIGITPHQKSISPASALHSITPVSSILFLTQFSLPTLFFAPSNPTAQRPSHYPLSTFCLEMTNTITFVAWVYFVLLSQTSLASPSPLKSSAELDKRSSWQSWWTYSSQDGYKSGTGTTPAQSSPRPTNGNPGLYSSQNADTYVNQNRGSPSQGGSYGPSTKTPSYSGPKIFTSSSDIKQWLDQHNKFRAQYKAAPLKWSETLVAASKRLTDTCVWRHTQNNRFGENMSAGQTSIREVVTGWVAGPDERDSYSGGNTEPSHFTQVVWQATTEVGCHKATCRDVRGANLPQSPVTFWACNYNPAGNVIGEIAQNVKAAPGVLLAASQALSTSRSVNPA
ncbi:hypothetical protein PSTT_09305, partial [Puccinia striiformis]